MLFLNRTNRTFDLDENAIEKDQEQRHANNTQPACKSPKLNPLHVSVLTHIKTLGNLDCERVSLDWRITRYLWKEAIFWTSSTVNSAASS